MKRICILVAAVAVMALAAAPGAHAAGLGTKAQAQVLGPVVDNGDGTATVTARYTCPEGFHLWVSAKQVASRLPDKRLQAGGSSEISAGWWQSHPENFTCDGAWRTGSFVIGTFEYGIGSLEAGSAWVQFCLIGENTFLSEQRWVAVKA